MSSVSSFINKNQQVLCDEYNAIINCNTDIKSGKNLFLLTDKTDFLTTASENTKAIKICQKILQEIDLFSGAERNALSEFEGVVKKLKNFFEYEITFSSSLCYIKANEFPYFDLAIKIEIFSVVVFSLIQCSSIALPRSATLLTELALGSLLFFLHRKNRSWNNMIEEHSVLVKEATVLLKYLKEKIKSAENIETSKVEIVKKESPVFAENDVESKGFSFNQSGAIAEQSQSGAMAEPFQNVGVKGDSFGS